MNSGPTSFIEISNQQYESDNNSRQMSYVNPQVPPQLPPKKTPVMGTKTIHRRTLSNSSSNNRNFPNEPIDPRIDLDYRFHNFNITGGAINREPHQFHSVPYTYADQPHEIPNRMRLYENISHFQNHFQSASLPSSHCPTPIKSSKNDTNHQQESYKSPISISNAEKRKLFFEAVTVETTKSQLSNGDQIIVSEANLNNVSSSRINSTGCTPTHSTSQDSFSDSSYLSALARFSPDNFLCETNTFNFQAGGRNLTTTNIQRSMVRRAVELDEIDKS